MSSFALIREALNFIGLKHGIQLRKDEKTPYVIHPIRVYFILKEANFSEQLHQTLLISALLHDVLEDTDTSLVELEEKFGKKITEIVKQLTKPRNMSKDSWLWSFENFSEEAKIIKMADRIDNLKDMGADSLSQKWKKSYAKQAEIVLKVCGKANELLARKLKETIKAID